MERILTNFIYVDSIRYSYNLKFSLKKNKNINLPLNYCFAFFHSVTQHEFIECVLYSINV